jgi:DNA-binding NtrC family response regulator
MTPDGKSIILLAEDDVPQRKILAGFLKKKGYLVLEAGSAEEARAASGQNQVDLLLTDLRLGGPDGIELLTSIRQNLPDVQAVVLTAYGTVDDAVRAMRAGAYDFLSKPVELARLEVLVEKALEKVSLSRENRSLSEAVKSSGAFSIVVGQSAAVQKILGLAAKVAPSRASVLLLGESGTGKEVLARSIHLASPRKNRPFVTANLAAMPETLIESELFGHEQGAFTGAVSQKKGRFELAGGGTLFLDEIGEIPPHIQVKLLNILQSGRFERVGGTKTISTDVRIIAATNRDLGKRVSEGFFREDLYYRLNVVTLTVPPLRDRREDIPFLVNHFLAKQADLSGRGAFTVDDGVLKLLGSYTFPGNVRELENWIERAVVLAEGDRLTLEDFPEQLASPLAEKAMQPTTAGDGLEEQVAVLEIALLTEALEKNNGNQSAAARDLKITERSIRYKIKKYGL